MSTAVEARATSLAEGNPNGSEWVVAKWVVLGAIDLWSGNNYCEYYDLLGDLTSVLI